MRRKPTPHSSPPERAEGGKKKKSTVFVIVRETQKETEKVNGFIFKLKKNKEREYEYQTMELGSRRRRVNDPFACAKHESSIGCKVP